MRWLALVLLVLLLAAPAGSAAVPRLSVVDVSPLTVKGVGFAPRERVRLVATVDHATRWSRAGAGGAFVLRFSGIAVPSCTAFSVRALGATGTRAIVRVPQLECPQPPAP
jgi:hypothetical protein